ncbi:hypothetical protein BJY00DRAFT_309755 [Aspergillus carlsbadensis]|nr:hypothetical protein BJY00DRAFT_309755 [Aspergillus carlsbadensis]
MRQSNVNGERKRKRKRPAGGEPQQPLHQPHHQKRKSEPKIILDPEDPDYITKYWILKGNTLPKMAPLGPREQALAPFLAKPRLRRLTSDWSAAETKSSRGSMYGRKICADLLEARGCYITGHDERGIAAEGTELCQELLAKDFETPKRSVFEDQSIEATLEDLETRNEPAVLRIMGELVVPSAASALRLGQIRNKNLPVSIDEVWDHSIALGWVPGPKNPRYLPSSLSSKNKRIRPLKLPRVQPDYAVGFSKSAFTPKQLDRLDPFIGEVDDISFFRGTSRMYFPFMVSEVKSESVSLLIAGRPILHAMGLCLRGIVNLFKMVGHEKELDRQALGFSITHNVRTVVIWAHYPVISGKATTFHAHKVKRIFLSESVGEAKWTAYKFTLAVYEHWAPVLLSKLCSAIDQIPADLNFDPLPEECYDTDKDAEGSGNGDMNGDTSRGEDANASSSTSSAATKPKPKPKPKPSNPFKKPKPPTTKQDKGSDSGADKGSSNFVPDNDDAGSPDEGSQEGSSSSSSSAPPLRKRKKVAKKATKKSIKQRQKTKLVS